INELKDDNEMAKIFSVNAGSSSLKFQLFEMPEEKVITKGLIERIGLNESVFSMNIGTDRHKEVLDIPNHEVAVSILLDRLTSLGVIANLNEIQGVGHRVVHGGELFNDSVLINSEILAQIDQLSELAPLHNPANVTGIREFHKALPNVPHVAVFDTAFHKQCLKTHIYTVFLMNTIKSMAFVSMVSMVLLINMYQKEQQNY